MHNHLEESISQSLEAQKEILPYIPDLVADLWALGSSPDRIAELLKPLPLSKEETKVIDLGCGKGAVSITVAHQLGFRVLGIDGYKPFLEDAERKATEFDVSELCHFEFGDMREFIKVSRDFDVVIYASIGNVLGTFNECVGKLRQTIRPEGYIIIDDGFLKGSTLVERTGYEHYRPHDETLRQLTSYGDTLIYEVVLPDEEIKAINDHYLEVIKKRADILNKRHPELKECIHEYIKNQEVECQILDNCVAGAIWLLQRRG